MPAQLIPKGLAETSLVSQVVVSKYRDYQLLHRQQHIFARADVELPVSTMADWVGMTGVALAPLAELLQEALLRCPVVHADETKMRILDTKKAVKPVPAICGLTSAVKKVALLSSASTVSPAGAAAMRRNT